MTTKLCVVGGDAAGMSAASQVKRAAPEFEVVVFEMGSDVSYAACGIPYFAAGLIPEISDLVVRTADQFRDAGIEVRLRSEVRAIDLDKRSLEVWDADARAIRHEPFDLLMIATGSYPFVPAGFETAYLAHNLKDARRLDRVLSEERPRRVVIAGGGYIGLEMAEAMRMRGYETQMFELADHVMPTMDVDMARLVETALESAGVSLHLGQAIKEIVTDGEKTVAVVVDDEELPCDLVIAALGSRPRIELADEAGITLGDSGAIAVDHTQLTSSEGIYAAGDCAEVYHIARRKWVNIHLGTVANKTGRVAGLNIAGRHAEMPGVVGTAVSRICDTEVARTGLNEAEASEAGYDFVAGKVTTSTRAHYYPGAGEMQLKMLADRETRKVLGVQIVGAEGAAKRVDVIAVAITQSLTVDQVVELDLSYAPPFSPVWDPVQTVARRASAVLDSVPTIPRGPHENV